MEKLQTPIAKAIEHIGYHLKMMPTGGSQYISGMDKAYYNCIKILQNLKKYEEENLKSAYEDGFPPIGANNSNEWFDEKYTQK